MWLNESPLVVENGNVNFSCFIRLFLLKSFFFFYTDGVGNTYDSSNAFAPHKSSNRKPFYKIQFVR